MDKKQTQVKHVELRLRNLITLLIIFILSLPTAGFKLAEWYYLHRDGAALPELKKEAALVINNAEVAKEVYEQQLDATTAEPAPQVQPFVSCDPYAKVTTPIPFLKSE